MMTYQEWFKETGEKHNRVYKKLVQKNLSHQKIVEYFRWENMKDYEEKFCVLYKENKKCHDIGELNCFFCGCPNFRFNSDENLTIKSFCSIDSYKGKQSTYNGITHQDCSLCNVPHKEKYVHDNFTYDWFEAMKCCEVAN